MPIFLVYMHTFDKFSAVESIAASYFCVEKGVSSSSE